MTSRFWKIVAAFWAFIRRDALTTAEFADRHEQSSRTRADGARLRHRSPPRDPGQPAGEGEA